MVADRRASTAYTPTAEGLRRIESGEMAPFDPEMYANFNTVVLEQYMEERNRNAPGISGRFSLLKLLLMIVLIGVPYVFVTQYIALKFGLVISALFYIAYLVGLSFKWRANEVNILASATNLVDQTMASFVFVFPAIFILAYGSGYVMEGGERVIPPGMVPDVRMMVVIMAVSAVSGLLALIYYIIYRRLWVVEEPLPTPGFESLVKLMELSNSVSSGLKERARTAMRMMGVAGVITFIYTFVREYPMIGGHPNEMSIVDRISVALGTDQWIHGSGLTVPWEITRFTRINMSLSALAFSIGWYMRRRISLYFFAGSAFMWFFLVPLALIVGVPYFWPLSQEYFNPNLAHTLSGTIGYAGIPSSPPDIAGSICLNIAIGVLLGAGLVTIGRFIPSMRGMIMAGRRDASRRDPGDGPGRTSYDPPTRYVWMAMGAAIPLLAGTLWLLGGFPLLPSLITGAYLSLGGFLLYGVSVKIAGDSGFGPTIMMVSLSLIVLFVILGPFGGFVPGQLALLVLIGTIAFTVAMIVSVTVQWDYKTGLYIGTPPRSLLKAQLIAVAFGVPVCAIFAALISEGIAKGVFQVQAPQPYAFSTLVVALSGGRIHYTLLFLGLFIGTFIELLTGKGTIFGIGMFFGIGLPLVLLIGGTTRDLWEERMVRRYGPGEGRTLRLLDSYMVMTGIFVGEAMLGLLVTLHYLLRT